MREDPLASLYGRATVGSDHLAHDPDRKLCSQLPAVSQNRPRLQIEFAYVCPRVGKNDRSFLRPLGGAAVTPAFDQLLLRVSAIFVEADRTVGMITIKRQARLTACEVARRLAL